MCEYNHEKCFFVKGMQLFWYNNHADHVEGESKLFTVEFPLVFPLGIDACMKTDEDTIYFFRGNEFEKFSIKNKCIAAGFPKQIKPNWKGMPFDSIDACFVSSATRKAYFFKGPDYVRYDLASDQVDAGYPMKVAKEWKGTFNEIDSVSCWPAAPGKAYFFKGSNYVRYDLNADRADDGYPQDVAKGWHGMPD
jgi:hypothetical protein